MDENAQIQAKFFTKDERVPPPLPVDTLVHDDWVSAVHTSDAGILSGCYDNSLAHLGSRRHAKTSDTGATWDQSNAESVERRSQQHAVRPSERRVRKSSRKKQKTIDGKAKTRVPVLTLSGHHEAITGVQWTDDKEVATCSMDHTLRLWDVDLGGMKSQLVGSKAFLDIAYSRTNNQIISAHTDRHIRLWDVRSKDGAMVTCTYSSHFGWVSSVHWAPESAHHFVSGSYDGFMKHWDVRSPKAPLYDMTGHEDKVLAVDWSLQKYMISGGADCHMKIFEFQ
ncbi:hypothetical protein MRX96_041128 [Rhipicephalus microplus]